MAGRRGSGMTWWKPLLFCVSVRLPVWVCLYVCICTGIRMDEVLLACDAHIVAETCTNRNTPTRESTCARTHTHLRARIHICTQPTAHLLFGTKTVRVIARVNGPAFCVNVNIVILAYVLSCCQSEICDSQDQGCFDSSLSLALFNPIPQPPFHHPHPIPLFRCEPAQSRCGSWA
jgi:hypothetical protein